MPASGTVATSHCCRVCSLQHCTACSQPDEDSVHCRCCTHPTITTLQDVYLSIRENNWRLRLRRKQWHLTYDL
jgi:hypothetical protein